MHSLEGLPALGSGPEETIKYLIARIREGVIWPSVAGDIENIPTAAHTSRPTERVRYGMEGGFRVRTMQNQARVLDPFVRPRPSVRPSIQACDEPGLT